MKKTHRIKNVALIHQEKLGEAEDNPYLSLHRLKLQNTYDDNTLSTVYPYDAVLRKWLDAVAVVLIARIDGRLHVCLRSAIRPPLLLRKQSVLPIAETHDSAVLWELPAGLLEPEDIGEEGIIQRAQIEVLEETGYNLMESQMWLLSGAPLVSPGTIPERLWFAVAEVQDVLERQMPEGDGSPVEENAEIQWVALERALCLCDDGAIDDMKTELGIRRIASVLKRDGENL
ncbi:MAG: NUDIX domain-containing protein [Deltaproteobacteria bacterium]|nr:NUDIX domain-containing protein [Deltaproteobacteria bacterium]